MRRCRRCERRISDDGSEHRAEWCNSIRRLLKLGTAQPEDYHQQCFIDAVLDQGNPRWRAGPRPVSGYQGDLTIAAASQALPPQADPGRSGNYGAMG